MSFGLSSSGFNKKRLENIFNDLVVEIKNIWPESRSDPESVIGQIMGVISKPYTDLWELAELVYLSRWASSSVGISLDYVLELNGLSRLGATNTVSVVGLKGVNNTIIQTGKQIKSSVDDQIYEFLIDTVITNIDVDEIFITVDTVIDNTDYQIDIDLYSVFMNSGIGSTPNSIATALVNEINTADPFPATAELLAGGVIHIFKKTAKITVSVSSEMSWYSFGEVKSINTGEIYAPSNSLTIIETPVTGWSNVNNFRDDKDYVSVGRITENDTDARVRRKESLKVVGGGSLEALISRIRDEVDDVTTVKGFENRESIIVDSLKPHSVYLIVEGGSDEDIGKKIWEVKSGGTSTNGTDYFDVVDSQGFIQRMFWDRPVDVPLYLRITYTLYDEEIFPPDGEDLIKVAAETYGNSLEIGEDVIPGRFKGPIYGATDGIDGLIIEVSDDDATWQTTKYSIDKNGIAKFDTSRITIIT
jgi:hypothetical protein